MGAIKKDASVEANIEAERGDNGAEAVHSTGWARWITRVIDALYLPLFRRVMPIQPFRYLVCGGANIVFSSVLYFITYNYIIAKQFIDLRFVVVSPHIASLIVVFPAVFVFGYLLNKYVAFKHSPLKGRVQLIRYALSVSGSLVLNYAFLKLFVEVFHLYPTPSQVITTLIITIYSYLMQKFFTFKGGSVV